MKLTLFLLPLTVLAATIPAPSVENTQTLAKRKYTVSSDFRWGKKTDTRILGAWAPNLSCKEGFELPYEAQHFLWPWASRGPNLKVCTTKMHCPEGDHLAAPITRIETCPPNEDALARKLVSEGSSWNPPISMDEAYRAMHAVDPEEFKHINYVSKVAADVVGSVGNLAASKNQVEGKTQKGMTSRCTRTVKVKSGDSCYWIARNNGCSLKAFYAWNPSVSTYGQECNELWVGWSVCVSTK